MRWFKHFSDDRRDPKLLAIERALGEAGYARAMKLRETITQVGGSGPDFKPEINLRSPNTGKDWLAEELRISVRDLEKTLKVFGAVEFIEPRSLKRGIIRDAELLKRRDEWTSRHKNSGVTQEPLGSDSGSTPATEVDVDVRSRGQKQKSEAEQDAGRPQSQDAGLPDSPATDGGRKKSSRRKGKATLEARISNKLRDGAEDFPAAELFSPEAPGWWPQAQACARYVGYELDASNPVVSGSFAGSLANVWERLGKSPPLRGIVASKVIDACQREGGMWPPDFQELRDRLRNTERRGN